MYQIRINFEEQGRVPLMLTGIQPGKTLLEVCLEHNTRLSHDCGGNCSCKTCHIYLEKGEGILEEKSKREMDFLAKILLAKPNSRLSCQCVLPEGNGAIEITIPTPSHLQKLC
jgi:ferredoxin, 2Fe-2S